MHRQIEQTLKNFVHAPLTATTLKELVQALSAESYFSSADYRIAKANCLDKLKKADIKIIDNLLPPAAATTITAVSAIAPAVIAQPELFAAPVAAPQTIQEPPRKKRGRPRKDQASYDEAQRNLPTLEDVLNPQQAQATLNTEIPTSQWLAQPEKAPDPDPDPIFPSDPMPAHVTVSKNFYRHYPDFECGECQSTDGIICLPSYPLETQFVAASCCQGCSNSTSWQTCEEEANRIATQSRLIKTIPATVFPMEPDEVGEHIKIIEEANENLPELDANHTFANAAVPEPQEPPEQDTKQLVLEQVQSWPQEKQILEWEKLTSKQFNLQLTPEQRAQEITNSVLPELVEAMTSFTF